MIDDICIIFLLNYRLIKKYYNYQFIILIYIKELRRYKTYILYKL